MKGFAGEAGDRSHISSKKDSKFNYLSNTIEGSVSDSETGPTVGNNKHQKSAIWSPSLLLFGKSSGFIEREPRNRNDSGSSTSFRAQKKSVGDRSYYDRWRASVRRVMMSGGTMRRILGFNRSSASTSKSNIWLLGVCYQVSQEGDDENSSDPTHSEGFAAFVEDFSSRILITYRKGFPPIGDSKYTSDVYWGCMLRSSQMLLAQAFLFHKLGRSWRKSPHKLLDQSYVEILNLFGDTEDSPCSIHNLLESGKPYGLAPGSWMGPYAMCRALESLMRHNVKEDGNEILSSMMAVYVVSGDGDGERGGAPVLCIEDVVKLCSEFSGGQNQWSPILLLVPLVLGLDKVNPRYLPLLSATFSFPQSLGILGGRPGASTYIVGVQDDKAFYLDPHDVQQVVDIKRDDLEADTSSYHCNVVRDFPLDSIDSSLAIGFYCKDKNDFDDFCARATELFEKSNGAPLFTIAQERNPQNQAKYDPSTEMDQDLDSINTMQTVDQSDEGDDWQLL